jgi:spermidine/putrescine-binding protein
MKKLLAVIMFVFLPGLVFGAKQEVYVFNWTDYIDPAVIKQDRKSVV